MKEKENHGSPRILSSGWGKMEVEGLGKGKDFKLWPGGGRQWDWAENGTGHRRGIQQGDVDELVSRGCTKIVLTTGRMRRLRVADTLIDYLRDQGVVVERADTKSGIHLYNEAVAQGEAVGGLFHTTC